MNWAHGEIDRILDNCIYGDYKIFVCVLQMRLKSWSFLVLSSRQQWILPNLIAVDLRRICISRWGYDFDPLTWRLRRLSHPSQDSNFGFEPAFCHAASAARTLWLVWKWISLHFSNKALALEKILATACDWLKIKLEKGLEVKAFRDPRFGYVRNSGKPLTRLLIFASIRYPLAAGLSCRTFHAWSEPKARSLEIQSGSGNALATNASEWESTNLTFGWDS